MMKNTSDGKVEAKIDVIKRIRIIKAWDEGKNLKQISEEMDLPIGVVNRNLMPTQRKIVEGGVKTHGRGSNI